MKNFISRSVAAAAAASEIDIVHDEVNYEVDIANSQQLTNLWKAKIFLLLSRPIPIHFPVQIYVMSRFVKYVCNR